MTKILCPPYFKMKDCNKMSQLDAPLSKAMALKLEADEIPEKGNPYLYNMAPGVGVNEIDDETHKETIRKYGVWKAAKNAANELRAEIQTLRRDLPEEGDYGPLWSFSAWQKQIAFFRQKYQNLRAAYSTHLPLSFLRFQRILGVHKSTREDYQKILLSQDPVRKLARVFGVEESRVEEAKIKGDDEYLEWTYLARIINSYAKRRGARECIDYTLEQIHNMIDATYMSQFPKVKVLGGGGMSTTISGFRVSLDELRLMFEFVRKHSSKSGAEASACAKCLLKGWEVIWGFPIPDDVREWIDVDPRMRMEDVLDVASCIMYRSGTSINLVSSESEDDEVVQDRAVHPIASPCCRPNLYYAQTTLTDENGVRLNQFGLFTSVSLGVGAFISMYNGDWYDYDYYESLPSARRLRLNEYAIQTDDSEGSLVVAPPLAGTRPDPNRYPASMANEPQAQLQANAMLVEHSFLIDDINVDASTVDQERVDDEFVGVGLVACRQIGPHREIFWSYGGNFPRRYTAGRGCRSPRRSLIENPIDIIGRIPRDACSLDVRDE